MVPLWHLHGKTNAKNTYRKGATGFLAKQAESEKPRLSLFGICPCFNIHISSSLSAVLK